MEGQGIASNAVDTSIPFRFPSRVSFSLPETRIYVDGAWQQPIGTETFESINPATALPVATFAWGAAAEGIAAVYLRCWRLSQ